MFKYSLTADKESNEVLDEMLTFYILYNIKWCLTISIINISNKSS